MLLIKDLRVEQELISSVVYLHLSLLNFESTGRETWINLNKQHFLCLIYTFFL